MGSLPLEFADLATKLVSPNRENMKMDMMLLGELVETTPTYDTYTGFWMPAGGNDGVAAIEIYYISTAAGFTVHLDTKSSDDTDSVTSSIGSATTSGTGITKFDVAGARDLVRYRIVQNGKSGPESMHMQLSQPLWSPN